MGLKRQQMGEGFFFRNGSNGSSSTRRVLDCAARRSPGWWRVQAAFHICCLHMGNLTLPLSRRPPAEPNKIIGLLLEMTAFPVLQHFLSSSFFFFQPSSLSSPLCSLVSPLPRLLPLITFPSLLTLSLSLPSLVSYSTTSRC